MECRVTIYRSQEKRKYLTYLPLKKRIHQQKKDV
jgi:hypothetical protein